MKCEAPNCDGETEVYNSRYTERSHSGIKNTIWRRRRCLKCGERFATYELRSNMAKEALLLTTEVAKVRQAKAMLRKLLEP